VLRCQACKDERKKPQPDLVALRPRHPEGDPPVAKRPRLALLGGAIWGGRRAGPRTSAVNVADNIKAAPDGLFLLSVDL
jgi:hypothetical protein